MRKFRIAPQVFEIFPQLQIAVLTFCGVDNSGPGRESYLRAASDKLYAQIKDLDGLHPHIADYSLAMRQIKRKKGALASIEAMAKRIKDGQALSSINPVVDLYNSVSLGQMFTCGGEDLDKIQGDMLLDFAHGAEEFIPLGGSENSPPREGELVYKDDLGVVVRSWLWREAERTKLTGQARNVLLYMELINENRTAEFTAAAESLYNLVLTELGGNGTQNLLTRQSPECPI